jgi:hypothetical protein
MTSLGFVNPNDVNMDIVSRFNDSNEFRKSEYSAFSEYKREQRGGSIPSIWD